MNLSRVSSALCGPRCLVPRSHSSARPKRSGRVVQAKGIDREGLGKRRTGTRQRSTYISCAILGISKKLLFRSSDGSPREESLR